jgi:hypothetical protein
MLALVSTSLSRAASLLGSVRSVSFRGRHCEVLLDSSVGSMCDGLEEEPEIWMRERQIL